MNEYNDKGERHGYWEGYNSNGKLWYKTNYVNGKINGIFEWYYTDCKLIGKMYRL